MPFTDEQCAELYAALENLLQAMRLLIKELSENPDDDPNNDSLIASIKKLSNDIRILVKLIDEKCDGGGE